MPLQASYIMYMYVYSRLHKLYFVCEFVIFVVVFVIVGKGFFAGGREDNLEWGVNWRGSIGLGGWWEIVIENKSMYR